MNSDCGCDYLDHVTFSMLIARSVSDEALSDGNLSSMIREMAPLSFAMTVELRNLTLSSYCVSRKGAKLAKVSRIVLLKIFASFAPLREK